MQARTLTDDELRIDGYINAPPLPADVHELLNATSALLQFPLEHPHTHREFQAELLELMHNESAGFGRHKAQMSFSAYRLGNCRLWDAFKRLPDAPCLHTPSLADWHRLLSGRTIAFLGDSVLRDLFVHMCVVLAPWAAGASATQRTHFGTDVGGRSYAFARFHGRHPAATIMLKWCNHDDDTCVQKHMPSRMLSASVTAVDALVAHAGAHCTPLTGACALLDGWPFRCQNQRKAFSSSFAALQTGLATAVPPSPALASPESCEGERPQAALMRRMHARQALVWLEYPPPHFAVGLGESTPVE